jgi:diguanylate cyclase (GGDEF)-like protein
LQHLNLDVNLDKRLAQDLIKRMRLGGYVYPALWLGIALGGDWHHQRPLAFWGLLLSYVLFAIIRHLYFRHFHKCPEDKVKQWLARLPWVVLPPSVIWGLTFAYSLTIEHSYFSQLLTFASGGIIAGGVYNYSPSLRLSLSFILVMVVPPVLTAALVTHAWFLFSLLTIYLFFMIHMALNQKSDYWNLLHNELELEKKSHTDALTNLDNRRYFDQKLNEYCHLSTRNHEQLSVMLIDCDHFKQINDQYGHDVGDHCLKHVAQILQSELPRVTDVCARYGGEEFSIILPGTNLPGAQKVAERIRQAIDNAPLSVGNQAIHITVSIGCVSRHVHSYVADLPEQLFKQADIALYRAKENGRNRSEFNYYDDQNEQYVPLEAEHSLSNAQPS